MISILYRLLLTFNATSLIIVVFLVKAEKTLADFISYLNVFPPWLSYVVYFLIPVLLTAFSLSLSKYLDNDSLESNSGSIVAEVEHANNAYLPSYLGYFFVALSVPQCETLVFVFFILFVFTYLSQTLYFNPLFLFFGYHFYYVTTINGVKNFIITKKVIKTPKTISFSKLKRINDFTFIDKE